MEEKFFGIFVHSVDHDREEFIREMEGINECLKLFGDNRRIRFMQNGEEIFNRSFIECLDRLWHLHFFFVVVSNLENFNVNLAL